MRRDIQMQRPTSAVLNHHKSVEQAKRRSDRDEEVAGNDRASMIAYKRRPALIATRSAGRELRHVFPHCSRRDPKPEFEPQLIGDTLLPPKLILGGHASDQLTQFDRDWGRPGRDLKRHSSRKPARCQPISVSERTTTNEVRQSKSLANRARLTRVATSGQRRTAQSRANHAIADSRREDGEKRRSNICGPHAFWRGHRRGTVKNEKGPA
jgi:hypothetical protein